MRAKRKNIEKTLQSIPISNHHHQHLKVLTQNSQPFCIPRDSQRILLLPSANDDKGMRVLRRYRYKQNKEEESEANLNKYKSLQMPRRNLKRNSQHKLNQYGSIQNSPYKPFVQKKSAQRLHPEKDSTKRIMAVNMINRENKKNSLTKKVTIRTNENPLGKQEVISIKERAKLLMQDTNYAKSLKLLETIDQSNLNQTDIQLLDLKGSCLMNLKRFQQALLKFSRVLLLDKLYNKKVYISIALCQNQLNHAERCIYYVNQCIQYFPDFYEAFYFKGKLLFKQKMYEQSISMLLQAIRLNPNKKDMKLLIAQCYEAKGDTEKAFEFYQQYLIQINQKNVKHGIKYGCLLVQGKRQSQGIVMLQKCLKFIEQLPAFQHQKIKGNYYLSLAYFRKKNYEMCTMKGEQILNSSQSQYVPKAIRILITCKILDHNYYDTIYFLRRLDFVQSNFQELKVFIQFSEGVMLLMKKKIEEGLEKLEKLGQILKATKEDEFNIEIMKNYRLFIIYSYFIQGKYQNCLQIMQQQKSIGIDPYFIKSIHYNQIICKAIIKYSHQQYFEAQNQLKNCISLFPEKVEAYLYLGVLHFKLYFLYDSREKREQCKTSIYENLSTCIQKIGALNNNYSAHIYYFRALLYAWEGEWALSACDLDIALEKSEDNFFNFYYLRAIVFANLQSYKQAISDVSIAISINEEAAFAYLLRAKCLQIDGNPSQAFADLQTFIALRPQDKQIHKFAGHLLFENGAFEDALQAYSQGQISEKDFEVYLTRSKTYFLLGNFAKSAQDLLQAAKMKGEKSQLYFDYKVVNWLADFFQQYIKNQSEDSYSFDKQDLPKKLSELRNIFKDGDSKYGKIFKLSEYLMLTALCNFYMQDYENAIDSLIQVIELKQLSMNNEDDGDFEQEQTEKLVFVNQMYYNLSICFCLLKDYPNAERYLKKCEIASTSSSYDVLVELFDQIKGKVAVDQNMAYQELFSLRNKLSRYLPRVKVPFLQKQSQTLKFRQIKFCIPYPKVQPPEINPSFDPRLIDEIDLNQIQRKADAPWIYRQKDSIKFTDRIDVYSRFQMQKSQVSQSKKHHPIGVNFSDSSLSIGLNIKEKLKLDEKLEEKLNKLIKKQK